MDIFNRNTVYDKNLARISSLRFFALTFLLIVVSTFTLLWIERNSFIVGWTNTERERVESISKEFTRLLGNTIDQVRILSHHSSLYNDSSSSRELLADHFLNVAGVLPSFHQIRFIDTNGMEIVRVDNTQFGPQLIPKNQLQDKSTRYYFTEGFAVTHGKIYVSPLDLNVEHGKIEQPFRPTLRFVTPVTDNSSVKAGVLVINFSANTLLDVLARYDRLSTTKLMLLNAQGYWLYTENKGETWGFQLPHGKSLAQQHPDTWQIIRRGEQNVIRSADGIFTYHRIDTLFSDSNLSLERKTDKNDNAIIANPPQWYLVSYSDENTLFSELNAKRNTWLVLILLAAMLLIPLSRLWGIRLARHRYASKRITTYASIIAQSNNLIYVASQSGEILYTNLATEHCYGYDTGELIGKRTSIFKSGRHPREFYKSLWDTILSGKTFEGIFVNRRKDGRLVYETKRIIPVSVDKEIVYVSMGQDLTEQSESKQREMSSMSRLSDGIQHHFNNLLNQIMGYIQLAMFEAEQSGSSSIMKSLKQSMESALIAESLVSRIASAVMTSYPISTKVNIKTLLSTLINQWRNELSADIELVFNYDTDREFIHASETLVETAIKGMLENAADAVGVKGKIEVTIGLFKPLDEICVNCRNPITGDHLAIIVEDTGNGIPTDKIKLIFDPFYSTKEESKLVAQTPGLGLTIARSVAHLHGGHMLVDSEPGKGTKIQLLLPILHVVSNEAVME